MPKTGDLKAQLEAEILDLESAAAKHPDAHLGYDWHELTKAEEQVFAINRRRFPRMMMTWHCYEVFKLIADATTWDDATIEQARRDYPQWGRPTDRAEGANAASVEEFQVFAKDFGGLTYRESWCMWAKNEAWQLRAGITFFADEQAEEGHNTGDLDDDIPF